MARNGPWSHAGVADANTTSMTFTPSDGDVFKTFFKVTAQFDGGETESSNVFKLKQTITSVERDEITSVSVFPNPCQDGRVTLRLPAPGTVVRILDPAGIEHLIVRSPSPQLELELHHLPAGLYFILISHPPLRITRKLLLL